MSRGILLLQEIWLVGSLCFTSHRQRGNLETASPFTVPYEGRITRFFTPFPPGIEPRAVVWQSITLPLRKKYTTKSRFNNFTI